MTPARMARRMWAKSPSAPPNGVNWNKPSSRCRHERAWYWYCTMWKAGVTRTLPAKTGMAVGSSKAQLHRVRGLLRRALGERS